MGHLLPGGSALDEDLGFCSYHHHSGKFPLWCYVVDLPEGRPRSFWNCQLVGQSLHGHPRLACGKRCRSLMRGLWRAQIPIEPIHGESNHNEGYHLTFTEWGCIIQHGVEQRLPVPVQIAVYPLEEYLQCVPPLIQTRYSGKLLPPLAHEWLDVHSTTFRCPLYAFTSTLRLC